MDMECLALYLDAQNHHVLRHGVDCHAKFQMLRTTALATYAYLKLKSWRGGKRVDQLRRQLSHFDVQSIDMNTAADAADIKRNHIPPAGTALTDERAFAAAVAVQLGCPIATVQPKLYQGISGLVIEDWMAP